jgi:hypothetical protein
MHVQAVTFSVARRGNDDHEWQDGAAWTPGDPRSGLLPRIAMADGATMAYSAADWAAQLVTGFVGPEGPSLTERDIGQWLSLEQDRWRRDPRWLTLDPITHAKLDQVGSFATFLGCELDLHGARPRWRAVAIGDTVLFHVRGTAVRTWFPGLNAEDFGYNPDGIGTKPEGLPSMLDAFDAREGALDSGDVLYLATDALAHWMIVENTRDPGTLWRLLASIDHPDAFARLVDDRWRHGGLHEDDITLTRVNVAATRPSYLVVCL